MIEKNEKLVPFVICGKVGKRSSISACKVGEHNKSSNEGAK